MYVHVREACLGTSEVSVAGNECSLGSDGRLRTSAEDKNAWQRSGVAIIMEKHFIPDKFFTMCM